MKLQTYKYPKSSFLSIEKDLNVITGYMTKNENLKKLLYYTSKDCLSKPKLTEEQSDELYGKNIKLIPKLYIDHNVLNYIIISFDNFTPNGSNPEFRDNIVEFDIICHFDQWSLNDGLLRPYRIAAEIDSMLNNNRLTGIGTLQFLGANQMILTDEYAGLCLMYSAIHGEEDKTPMANPNHQESFEENFNQIFNNEDR